MTDAQVSRSSPSNHHGTMKVPFWLKLAATMILVFITSIGLFRQNLLEHEYFPEVVEATGKIGVPKADDHDHGLAYDISKRKPMTDLKLIKSDGTSDKISSFKGKVVIVSFWASWCLPCLEELPTFAKLYNQYKNKGLHIVAINVDEKKSEAKFIETFWKKNKIPFLTYLDPQQINSDLLNVDVMPTNYVLDRKGRIAFASFGASNWAGKKATTFMEALLKEVK